jgi:hypothetical protein
VGLEDLGFRCRLVTQVEIERTKPEVFMTQNLSRAPNRIANGAWNCGG